MGAVKSRLPSSMWLRLWPSGGGRFGRRVGGPWRYAPVVALVLVVLAWRALSVGTGHGWAAEGLSDLSPWALPSALAHSLARMALALGLSFLFSLIFAALAAHSLAAERVLVPLLDVLQSVPILGFLSLAVPSFVALLPSPWLGWEAAAIFALFTSQAWNMALSLYQSLKTVPADWLEVARMARLSAWQRFWCLELPFATPALVWNTMMSVAGGWFFIVAAEAFTVAHQRVALPGMGSFIAMAIEREDLGALVWAMAALLGVILLQDRWVFQPLVAWSVRFQSDPDLAAGAWHPGGHARSARRRMGRLSRLSHHFRWVRRLHTQMVRWRSALAMAFPRRAQASSSGLAAASSPRSLGWVWLDGFGLAIAGLSCGVLWRFVEREVGWPEALHVAGLASLTLLRVLVLVALALLIWVPVGVVIGLHPRWSVRAQAWVQFLAAFPANVLFPLVVLGIVHTGLAPDIWLSPLMILGAQWYILFNVMAAASTIPLEWRLAADNLGLTAWLRWRRLLLPAVLPGIVTGGLAASGGAWNASIVAEWVRWGPRTLEAQGLGSYIAQMTEQGDYPRVALGLSVMAVVVLGVNQWIWRPLYRWALGRFHR